MSLATPRPSSLTWRVIALTAIVANVGFNYVSERMRFGIGSMAGVSDRYHTLFTPAGYAFSIWGVIYAGFLAYAIVTLLPGQRDQLVHDRLVRPLALVNLLTSLWIVVFRSGYLPASVLVIAATLVTGIVLYRRVSFAVENGALRTRWWTVPFGIFLGWISVATIANSAAALVSLGWRGGPGSEPAYAIALIGVAGALALLLAVAARESMFAAVIAWATLAIYIEQRHVQGDVAWAAIVVAALTGAAAAGTTLSRLVERWMHPPPAYRS